MISTAPPVTTSAGTNANPTGASAGTNNSNKPGNGFNKVRGGQPKKLPLFGPAGRRHSPQRVGMNELDRAHSVDGSGTVPVPLRRASYAFDHHGQRQHQKATSIPPYHGALNGNLIHHQHSAPVPMHSGGPQHQDSSDCGSSSGLGGMGTPVKGESGCSGSCSASSNNSVAADCSHDSRDSGGPLPSSPGGAANVEAAAPVISQNGHRSLGPTATLTQSMVSSTQQQTGTTISPVSSIPTLVQQPGPAVHQQQQQPSFQGPPPTIPHGQQPSQFGAFTPPVPAGQQLQPQHPMHPQQQHQFPQNHYQNHPAMLHHHAHSHAAAMAQFNALQAAAAASMLPPSATGNGMNGQVSAQTIPQFGPFPPQDAMSPHEWQQQMQKHKQHQQQMMQMQQFQGHQQPPMLPGRALYTMTCENAALASVGAAAVTAGYHVTLEPCASAPPIIAPPNSQQQLPPTSSSSTSCPQPQQQQCTPPPGFHAAAAPPANEGGGNGGAGGNEGNQQQQEGQEDAQNGGIQMNGPTNGGVQNGPVHPGQANNVMPAGVPPEIAAAISGGHDLFVHIHPGDAIALAVGNEIQHIQGPATIRMVSQSTPPSAIPMNVPQGHVVQQLLDRHGYLSHIIMSQEMAPAAIPTPPGMMPGQQLGGHQPHGQMQVPTSSGHGPRQIQNSLQPPQQQTGPHQQSPSPQKSNTPAGGGNRFRPSPSSSASPPTLQQQHPFQPFVLPPGYEQHQFLGPEIAGGAYGYPNPLNKCSPRGGGQFQPQPYGRRGGQQQMPGTSHGPPYIDSGMPPQMSQSPSGAPYGQQPVIMEPHDLTGQPMHPPFIGANQIPPGMQIGSPFGPGVPAPGVSAGGDVVPMSLEEDEKERLREALSSLQPPNVVRIGDREADVIWQDLDTSEAAASVPGFPEINSSEFAYQLILYEQNASTSVCYKADATSGNALHLQRLRPATEYMICIRADLPGHGITGHPSQYTQFRTLPSRPEAPAMPKLVVRHANTVTLQWRAPNCNGAHIVGYSLQMAKGKSGPFETVYEGPHDQATVNGLEPGAFYRFRLYCRNEIGQSDYSSQLNVYPDRSSQQPHYGPGHQPHIYGGKGPHGDRSPSSSTQQQHPTIMQKPPPPSVHSVMARGVKLSWNDVQPGHDCTNVTLEMSNYSINGAAHFSPVPIEFYAPSGTFAHVTGLDPNREYRFRLALQMNNGETVYSDSVPIRTRGNEQYREHQRYEPHQHEKLQSSAHEEEQQHEHPRGSPAVQQPQKGGQQQKKVMGAQAKKPAVQPRAQPSQQSVEEAVEKTAITQKQEQKDQKAANCSVPKFTAITCESAKISWRLLTPGGSPKKGNSVDSQASTSGTSNAAMMFELQRVDRQQPQIIYSGNDTEFEMKGLKPVEHLQLRVRAVLLDTEGKRFEGDWSQVGSACTICAPPSAPKNLRPVEPESPPPTADNTPVEEEEARTKSHGHNHHTIALCWDQPTQLNGAPITEYTIYAQRFGSMADEEAERMLEERLLGSTTETHFQTPRLLPAQHYQFTVCAHNEAGASPKSEAFEFLSPPGVPEPPRDFHAEALSTSELQLSWSEPISANGAPVTSYQVNCYRLYARSIESSTSSLTSSGSGRQRQLVSQQIVPSSQRLLLIQSLETESEYELVLQAENSVGKSAREVTRCHTLAEPPSAPELALAQATANTLKLKWNPAGDSPASSNHYYYLERENENGTYSPVYEGDLRTAKVKGLRERTTHHFRIRAALAKGSMLGPWSKRYSFQTTRQPPAAPKQAPMATEVSTDLFQLEWNPVRGKEFAQMDEQNEEEQQQFIYRLQVAPKVASSAKEKSIVEVWKTVYEGTSTQCTVPVPNASQQARQARLLIVQQFLSADGQLLDECVSAPSPITVFSSQKTPNESPKKRPLQGGKNAAGPSGSRGRQQQAAVHYPNPKEPKVSMYKRLKRFGSWMKKTVSEKDCALIVLAIFVVLAFGIAILLNNYYLN